MHVSHESPEQTEERLRRVIREAQFELFERPHTFVEAPLDAFPGSLLGSALAFVRDNDVWSALVPCTPDAAEPILLFGFHFAPGFDNSGFVGWLASHLKRTTGSGVMVVCGQNSGRGGIFDYWGAPWSVAHAVLAEVQRLRAE